MARRPFELMPNVMRATARQIELNVQSIARRAAETAGREVILGTPVDTGRARSNWRASIDGPTRAEIPPYAPGMRLGIGERANALAAITALQVVVAGFTLPRNTSIHITNVVRYIGKLNRGSSRQAQPPGFVNRAIVAAVASLRGRRVLPNGVRVRATAR